MNYMIIAFNILNIKLIFENDTFAAKYGVTYIIATRLRTFCVGIRDLKIYHEPEDFE